MINYTTGVVSEIKISTILKSAAHLSQLIDRSKTEHDEAMDRLPDPK